MLSSECLNLQQLGLTSTDTKPKNFTINFMESLEGFRRINCKPDFECKLEQFDDAERCHRPV